MNGSIRRRGSRSWEIRFDPPRGADGKRRRQNVNVKDTKAEAQRWLRELLRQVDTGLPPTTSKETVGQFMARWLSDHVAHTTRPRTRQFYEQINRLYIAPEIGEIPIRSPAPVDVQRVIAGVISKGLSPTTARRVYATLHRALACALKWSTVYRNVCDAIDAPREADHEINPPDKEMVRTLQRKAEETSYRAAFWLLAYTGMRRGEVCAIKQDHLDLDAGTLSIVGAVGRENGHLVITPPKSAKSRRMIHLDGDTASVLRSHLANQAEHRLRLDSVYHDQRLVFASPTGGLLDSNILTKTWREACREAGVRYTLRSLRHHHATALIEAGVHIKAVQARLGHSSPSLTLAVYAHVTPGMDKAAAEAYAAAMAG